MKQICIKIIPHSEQRYPTTGDYWIDPDGTWQIRVSELGDFKYEVAVALHELWEQALCFSRGIEEKYITEFDKEFEKNRKVGDFSEPGDDRNSPYQKEHCSATGIERLFISEIEGSWNEYEDNINSL
jgi:hypothetical protein